MAFIASMLAACTGDAPGPDGASRIEVNGLPSIAFSAETISFAVTLSGGAREPAIALMPSHGGSASSERIATSTDRQWMIRWRLGDVDTVQSLRIAAVGADTALQVTSRPHLESIAVAPVDTVIESLGAVFSLRATGRTRTGRLVALNDGLLSESEVRVVPELPVTQWRGALQVESRGPGVTRLAVVSDSVRSSSATVTVRTRQPIVRPLSTSLARPGDEITIEGLNLDAVASDGVRDESGRVLPLGERSATRLTVRLPAESAQCAGAGTTTLVVGNAVTVAPPTLTLARTRDIVLAPGEFRELDVRNGYCLQLRAEPGVATEYALATFDTRSIVASRTTAESFLPIQPAQQLTIRDLTRASGVVRSTVASSPAGRFEPVDLVSRASGVRTQANAFGAPPDFYELRTTPWATGDRVSVRWDADYLSGMVFRATNEIAWAVLDRDASYNIPARLLAGTDPRQSLDSVDTAVRDAVPILQSTFGAGRATTIVNSPQILVIVGPISGATGLARIGNYFSSGNAIAQGITIWVDPGVVATPASEPLYIHPTTLVHEFVHAYQDRYSLSRCASLSSCTVLDGLITSWSAEGNAAMMVELIGLGRLGVRYPANTPLTTLTRNNLTAPLFTFQPDGLVAYGRGYDSSSWLQLQLVARLTSAGASLSEAIADVSRGSIEGWQGLQVNATRATGLEDRLRRWLGANERVDDRALFEAIALAVDDRVPGTALAHQGFFDIGSRYPAAARFTTGEGLRVSANVDAYAFGWYQLSDQGIGGSFELGATPAGWRWGLVRVR